MTESQQMALNAGKPSLRYCALSAGLAILGLIGLLGCLSLPVFDVTSNVGVIGFRIIAVLFWVFELGLCATWIRLSTARLTVLGRRKRWAFLPATVWIAAFTLPFALDFAEPGDEDFGPVSALMAALLVASTTVSIVFAMYLTLARPKLAPVT